jgi:hypothetical protein
MDFNLIARCRDPSDILRRDTPRRSKEVDMNESARAVTDALPFDSTLLDKLMDEAGIDVLVATSKHNIKYLLGRYRFFFYENMDAIGTSRYLPALVYRKGNPGQAAYLGCSMEKWERELGKFWPRHLQLGNVGSTATAEQILDHLKALGGGIRRVGVELAFLPADAERVLRQGLSNIEMVDAVVPLERLRARKAAHEIDFIEKASARVVESMLATFAACEPGVTKQEVVKTLRREEVSRDLMFDYCLITFGTSFNRAPSEQRLETGDIISLDSGGNYQGYIGDLCMIVVGAIWSAFTLTNLQAALMHWTWVYSGYANWLGCLVGAATGAGQMTPIAAGGRTGPLLAEMAVSGALISVRLTSLIAAGLSIWGLRKRTERSFETVIRGR